MSIFHCINTIIFIGVLPMCTLYNQKYQCAATFYEEFNGYKNNHKWVWCSRMDIWKCAPSHKDFWFLITLWIDRSSYISLIQVILEHQLFWSILHLLWKQLWHNTCGVFFLVQTGDTQWPWAWLCPHQKLLLRENPMNRAPGIEWGGRLRFKFWDLDVFSNQG